MIILVRHGEATHHTEHLTGGWTDSELTERGKQQMQNLAEILVKEFAGHSVPAIFSSDLQRANASANIISLALGGNNVQAKKFLREKNNGKAAGLTEEEARKYYRRPLSEKELDHDTEIAHSFGKEQLKKRNVPIYFSKRVNRRGPGWFY